ncbi:hypothetical protein [Streptomyces sp. NPDC053427]|uniref:hypothetical protein n=1 Tax=Streptomyces sp. NPDC053427 TaxID=3365701 RepID=UPI0037D0057E
MSTDEVDATSRWKYIKAIAITAAMTLIGFMALLTQPGGWRNPGLVVFAAACALSTAVAVLAWRKEKMSLSILAVAMTIAVPLVEKAVYSW